MLDELANERFSVSASNAIPNSDIVTAANNHNTVRKGSSYSDGKNTYNKRIYNIRIVGKQVLFILADVRIVNRY